MRAIRHGFEYAGLQAYAGLARFLPRAWALRMGQAVGAFGWLVRLRRSVVMENLQRVFPDASVDERVRIARASCRNFGRSATEFARFGKDRRHVLDLVEVSGTEPLREAAARDGAVVVTGHLGAWALYVTALAAHGVPTALLVGKQSNPRVDRFIHSLPGDAVAFIGKGPFAPRGVLRSLGERRAVLMVADQHSRVGVDAPFLGHSCKTLSLPGAILAKRLRPLFLLEGYHLSGGRHRVELRQLDLQLVTAECPRERVREITTLCNQAIGEAVLRHPEQYFWHHRRWRPADEEPCCEGAAGLDG